MNLTAIFLFVACLQVSAAGYSQDRITLSEKSTPLETVLQKIGDQSGYQFFFQIQIAKDLKVSVNVKNEPVEEVLRLCFKDLPFTYEIINKIIVIRKKEEPALNVGNDSGPGKTVRVHGTAYNEVGQPLAGANVVVKETQRGTITDPRGAFDLGAIPVNSTIIISYIGYERQVITVKEETNLRLVLKVAKNELDKVVIQAYGMTSQRLTTGSIGVVTSEQIERQPVINPIEALQGQVPGLLITQDNGYASAPFKVEIRGRNSISGAFPSDPLYIIDGVPLTISEVGGASSYANGSSGFDQTGLSNSIGVGGQSPFFSLNPADIESIEVLKDADATAIYGSRGANGVILITTKKGKAGMTKLDINVYDGISAVTKTWDMMNTSQYLFMRHQAFKNDGVSPSEGSAPDLLVWDTTQNTNWQNYLWGHLGKVTDVQAALSGGDARTTFRVSADYRRQTTILTVSGADQRAAISFNFSHKGLNQRFSVQFSNTYSFTQSNLVSLSSGVAMAPNAPSVYDALGELNWIGWAPAQSYYPFSNLLEPYTAKTNFLNSNLVFSYQVIKGLAARLSLGYDNTAGTSSLFIPIAAQNPQYNPTGSSEFGTNYNHGWIAEPQLEYNGYIGKGKLNALVGTTSNAAYTEGDYVNGEGYTSDFLLRSISSAPNVYSSSSSAEYKYNAIFGRLNYNFENKYILNLSARRDGSSRFAPGDQFGNFGSAGAAWIFTEEAWVKNHFPILSFGKFRASYGLTGSDQIGDYAYVNAWSSNFYTYNGNVGIVPIQHADSNYHWEVDKKAEVALDLGFLKDRITMEAAFYRNTCGNQLISFPTAEFTGFTSVTANSAANVQNEGMEYMLTAVPVQSKDFKWTVNFNVSRNWNKLLSYPNLAQSPYANAYIIGSTLNFERLLHYQGVDPQTGQYAYQDKSHNGLISVNPGPTDDRYVHDINPLYYGGLTNTITYKSFQLSFFVYFKQQVGRNALAIGSSNLGTFNNNGPALVFGHQWQYPGDKATFARFTTQPTTSDAYFTNSDASVTDASYIRLKNLVLSYSLPDKVLSRSGIHNLSIFVKGENLFLITGYKGLDPETQNFGGMPPMKTFTSGISVAF